MLSHAATMMSSHAGDGASRSTWPRRDVEAESCWRRCCRGDLATVRYRCQVMPAMALPRQLGCDAM
jgi:hypothetical protein